MKTSTILLLGLVLLASMVLTEGQKGKRGKKNCDETQAVEDDKQAIEEEMACMTKALEDGKSENDIMSSCKPSGGKSGCGGFTKFGRDITKKIKDGLHDFFGKDGKAKMGDMVGKAKDFIKEVGNKAMKTLGPMLKGAKENMGK